MRAAYINATAKLRNKNNKCKKKMQNVMILPPSVSFVALFHVLGRDKGDEVMRGSWNRLVGAR